MNRDYEDSLRDMLDSIERIRDYTKDFDEEKFAGDRKTQDAVTRAIEVLGEAVKSIPGAVRQEHAEIPWKEIAGMRDKLIHHYFGVDVGTLWKTAVEEIPKLENPVKEILRNLGRSL